MISHHKIGLRVTNGSMEMCCFLMSIYVSHSGVYCIAIERGKNGKAAGPDCLTNECMKGCLNVLLVAITGLFNYCFDNACCPSVWNTSYLLTLYKGKGDTSDPNSARGIALQS